MEESKLQSSVMLRMVIIAALTLILLIPASIVESIISERQERRDSVIKEVSNKWGNQQIIAGPILSLPFKKLTVDQKGRVSTSTHTMRILPDSLLVDGDISTESRKRGIYEVILYNSKLTLSGIFNTFETVQLIQKDFIPQWKDAFITIGISDIRGIKNNIILKLNSKNYPAKSGVRINDAGTSGITFFPDLTDGSSIFQFSFSLDMNGSSDLFFVPIGKYTEASLRSSWKNPSFIGEFLPEKKTINENGFSAQWKILELNRNYPQSWFGERSDIVSSNFGVRLLQLVNEYQQTYRTAKYALLLISLTFLSFFLSEVLMHQILHPIHYALIGLGLIVFYILLLSLSEYVGFDVAYFLASLSVILLITLYSMALVTKKRVSLIVGGIITLLYVFLYIVLQLEDFALLIGSIGLMVILSLVMFLTRRINWFNFSKSVEILEKK
jgi:inner membrane protein